MKNFLKNVNAKTNKALMKVSSFLSNICVCVCVYKASYAA